jgi:hypothetical protein
MVLKKRECWDKSWAPDSIVLMDSEEERIFVGGSDSYLRIYSRDFEFMKQIPLSGPLTAAVLGLGDVLYCAVVGDYVEVFDGYGLKKVT